LSKLDGKIAVITGGSSGIGLATARRFVDEGAHVFLTGRRMAELEKARDAIGRNVSIVQGDVASLEDLDRVFAQVRAEKGILDIVVASAGVIEQVSIDTASPEHFDKTFGINTRGAFFTVQKALPLMTRGGSIVLVASGLHLKGFPAHSTYSASKAALRSFTRTFAAELKGRGIRVNSLSPGATDTTILEGQFASREEADGARKAYAQLTPLGRLGRAEEIATAALFLASDDSSYSTGIDLIADGGLTQL
jgi:NAD(P)-dependent dehydrogenase (short-subunit alcohol dehydrogenase family)